MRHLIEFWSKVQTRPLANEITKPRLRSAMAMWLVLGFAIPMVVTATQNTSAEKYIEIDGKKEPGKIPDYLVWRSAFTYWTDLETSPDRAKQNALGVLRVSQKALESILEVSAGATQEDRELQNAILERQRQAGRQGKTLKEIQEMSRALELERRELTLAKSEVLLQKVTPEEVIGIKAWVEAFKSGIRVTVAESNLSFFFRPR